MTNPEAPESLGGAWQAELVGILGSPRRGGNTEFLLDRALAGAADAGRTTAKLVLNELDIRPCQNCGYCEQKGTCWIKDDMEQVYRVLDRAPRIVLASPIYFTNVSAQTKAMVDRCQAYWARRFVLKEKMPRAGGPGVGAFICLGGFRRAEKFFECARRLVASWYATLGIRYAKGLFYEHVDAKGDAEKHPTAGAECYELGRTL